MNCKFQNNRRAFTLIEMIIALAVSAIVLAAINGVFWGALRLRTKTVESVDAALPAERALSLIRADLVNIIPPGGKFGVIFQTTDAVTNAATGAQSAVMQGQSSPQFTTSNGIIDDSTIWGDIQRVSYMLVNSTNRSAGRDLYRVVTRNLLPATQNDGQQQAILSGVQSINFSYHDGQTWKDIWTTNETLRLPRAIRVDIEMAAVERNMAPPAALEIVVPLVDAGTNVVAQTTQ